jgi:energy-coupling factor transport system ATP-binding protein
VVITHDMAEAMRADRIIALDRGQVVADGLPCGVFSDGAMLSRIGAVPPYEFELMRALGGGALPEEVSRICRS